MLATYAPPPLRKPKFPPLTPDQQTLFDSHFSDAEKLARFLYRRYQSNRIQHEWEDFLAMAHYALVKATRGWKPERGVLFWSYFNAIFRREIMNHHQKKQMLCRKCPTRVLSIDAPIKADQVFDCNSEMIRGCVTLADKIDAPALCETKAIEDREEVEVLRILAEGLPGPKSKRNWAIVFLHHYHGMNCKTAGAQFGVKRANATRVIQETVARVRAKALAQQK